MRVAMIRRPSEAVFVLRLQFSRKPSRILQLTATVGFGILLHARLVVTASLPVEIESWQRWGVTFIPGAETSDV